MGRHELSESQWEQVKEVLPRMSWTGRPRKSDRRVVNGIMWILKTGAPWRDLPRDRFGPWKTVYNRFNKWSREGVFDGILEALQLKADEAGKINWDLWCIDGSVQRAHRVAAGARGGGHLEG